jgi:ABC-type transport system involved in multi-copper enzyme maturation permease subunit
LTNILKSDFYRFGKSKLFYGFAAFTALMAFSLMMLIRQDIRLGISVFGELTAFRGTEDIIRIGIQYQKGLGIFAAVLLSGFIGQEYQWKTWQHKWITNRSRVCIYLSKVVFSLAGSAAIFLIYETVALLCSGQTQNILSKDYAATLVCGVFVYAALGTVICLLSMLIRNSMASTIISLCYVLFAETLASAVRNISGFSAAAGRFVEFCIRHSVYGMQAIVSGADFSADLAAGIVINVLAIMLLSTALGLIVFRKYEL